MLWKWLFLSTWNRFWNCETKTKRISMYLVYFTFFALFVLLSIFFLFLFLPYFTQMTMLTDLAITPQVLTSNRLTPPSPSMRVSGGVNLLGQNRSHYILISELVKMIPRRCTSQCGTTRPIRRIVPPAPTFASWRLLIYEEWKQTMTDLRCQIYGCRIQPITYRSSRCLVSV